MKSYKQIASEIKPNQAMLDQTVQAMTTSHKRRFFSLPRTGLALTCCVALFLLIYHGDPSDRPKAADAMMSAKTVDFDDYIVNTNQMKYENKPTPSANRDESSNTMSELAGKIVPMNAEMQSEYRKQMPIVQQLVIPANNTATIEYNQYQTSDTTPYAVINYEIKNQDTNLQSIDIGVYDERIPQDLPDLQELFPQDFHTYLGYRLMIVELKNPQQTFIVTAYKDDFRYRLYATGVNKQTFYTFLKSFLI